MDIFVTEAFHTAIRIEKQSYDFYRNMATVVKDGRTRKVFELLADEEAGHLDAFIKVYPGSGFDLLKLLDRPEDGEPPDYGAADLSAVLDVNEKDALEISLREEASCIERYSAITMALRDPQLRDIFQEALEQTCKHFELVNAEYLRVMGMVDASDQDTFVRE
ncbi:ferritin family protein [Geobacter sp. FeAm09]|uniref:ferritin family protein n=1 Tax=Geobacter sp. FeAm09 TaxID=2597769 RepID=UPI00143CCAF9|nr:ferritin family protein [Geobacter sp. FeAm09]